jgi:hypothetical protein
MRTFGIPDFMGIIFGERICYTEISMYDERERERESKILLFFVGFRKRMRFMIHKSLSRRVADIET